MKNILAAIFFQLNPLAFPISVVIWLLTRLALGKDADPAYREPQPEDDANIAFIEQYVENGQPAYQWKKYLLCCKQLGCDHRSPFADSHPLAKVTILS